MTMLIVGAIEVSRSTQPIIRYRPLLQAVEFWTRAAAVSPLTGRWITHTPLSHTKPTDKLHGPKLYFSSFTARSKRVSRAGHPTLPRPSRRASSEVITELSTTQHKSVSGSAPLLSLETRVDIELVSEFPVMVVKVAEFCGVGRGPTPQGTARIFSTFCGSVPGLVIFRWRFSRAHAAPSTP